MDNELILFDRIEVIKTINEKYDLENNAYLSFSGGKDSTILHKLLDLALPGNKIPRVYIDTGIEYNDIKAFVKELSLQDERFIMLKPEKSIVKVLETYGYPFKSKEHSYILSIYQHSGKTKSVRKYLREEPSPRILKCPHDLEFQFKEDYSLKISDKCCAKLKKEPARRYERENHKNIAILGIRNKEWGQRASHTGCFVENKSSKTRKFNPLNPVSEEWESWFIDKYDLKLCKLYYPPYNFKRTGCKGCPFNYELKKDLETMKEVLPIEYKQCEIIWKKVYDEYRKHNYRLNESEPK